ncbi:MAG: leucine-rich repeat protein [Mogibacterium sp.]|nr:leucine-rich repeat protein [Mogibacterium sp.]
MKEGRRIFAIMLALAIVFTYMPAIAFADDGANTASRGKTYLYFDGEGDDSVTYVNSDGVAQTAYRTADGFAYTLVNSDGSNTVRIIGYNGGNSVINVPEKIHSRTVSGFSIDPDDPVAGETYNGITEINFPENVIYIRTKNLTHFPNLKSIGGVGGKEFENDYYYTKGGVLYIKKADSGVKAILPTALKSWEMENAVYKIVSRDCQVEEITLSEDLEDCQNITSFRNVKSYKAPAANEYYSTVDGVLYNKEGTSLVCYPRMKETTDFVIPNKVTYVQAGAFRNVENLQTLTFAPNIEYLNYSVYKCKKLEKVTLPASLTHDGLSFDNCPNLKTVVFTAKTAPSVEGSINWNFSGLRALYYNNNGVDFEYPANGEGYTEFIESLTSILEPIPDDPEQIVAGQVYDVQLTPGEVKTFCTIADKTSNYGIYVASEDNKTIDIAAFKKVSGQGTPAVNRNIVTYPYSDTYQNAYYNIGLVSGERGYFQFKSCNSNTDKTTVFKVVLIKTPFSITEIPAQCEELTIGEEKTGTITDENQVVTYLIRTLEKVPGHYYNYTITATRSSNHGENTYWTSSLTCDSDAFNRSALYGSADTVTSYPLYLDGGKDYYLQIQPSAVGEYSILVSVEDIETEEEGGYEFADVSSGAVESIATNEEKTVATTWDKETFTYEFIPTESGYYTFESSGTADTVGRVLSGDEVISMNDDSEDAGKNNFSATFYAEAGQTYYLQAVLYNRKEEATFTVKLHDYIGEHQHQLIYHPAVEGTPEKDGTKAYYECTVCGHYYLYENAKSRVYEENLTVPYGSLIKELSFRSYDGLTGIAESADITDESFYADGNKFVATFDDGSSVEYKYAEHTDEDGETYRGYYLDGDWTNRDISGDFKITVKTDDGLLKAGKNDVEFSIKLRGQVVKAIVTVTCEGQTHVHTAGEPVKENVVEATCVQDGSYDEVTYCTECGQELERKTIIEEKKGHTFDEGIVTKPATCETEGVKTFTCSECKVTRTEAIPAFGHDWSEPEYVVAEDNSSITATRICKNDASHTEEETAYSVSETTAASCEEPGEVTYSVTFENPAFSYDSWTVIVDKVGHDWDEPTYVWADDHSSITATRVCKRDSSHTEEETSNNITIETIDPTCETAGKTTYTATFTNPGFVTQTYTEEINALGHSWSEVTYTWAEDNSTVTAERVCANDPAHVEKETAATVKDETPAQYDKEGHIDYTAEFENEAFVTQTKTESIPTLEKEAEEKQTTASNESDIAQEAASDANEAVDNGQADADSIIASASDAANTAADAAKDARDAAQTAYDAAEEEYGEQSANPDAAKVDAAKVVVDAADKLIVATSTTVASVKTAAAKSASKKAAAKQAAADNAAIGTADAVAKAQEAEAAAKEAVELATEASNKAQAALDAAEKYGEDDEVYKNAKAAADAASKELSDANAALAAATASVTNAEAAKNNADQAAAAEAARQAAIAAAQPTEIQDLPAVKISKPKAAKKAVTVKWKKVSKKNQKKIGGIEIQVATDSAFTNIIKSTTAGKKKTSKKIKGLTSKQTVWVRVRAYKDAADGKHVSAWKTKKVKIK